MATAQSNAAMAVQAAAPAATIERSDIPREYFEKSDLYGAFVSARILGCFIAAVVLTPFLFQYSAWTIFGIIPLLGWAAYKIQFILHDCSHKTLFRTKQLNEHIGTFSGLLIGVYFKMYRYTHMNHHRINGEPDDPQYPDYLGGKTLTAVDYLKFIFSPLFGGRFVSYVAREFGPTLFKGSPAADAHARQGPAITRQWLLSFIVMQLLIATIVTYGWRYPLLMFALPLSEATISLFLSRVRTLAEHQRTQAHAAHDFSRTHLPSLFDKVVLYDANFNYHLEHHIEPQIPSKNLPAFYATHTNKIHTDETLGHRMMGTLYRIFRAVPS